MKRGAENEDIVSTDDDEDDTNISIDNIEYLTTQHGTVQYPQESNQIGFIEKNHI